MRGFGVGRCAEGHHAILGAVPRQPPDERSHQRVTWAISCHHRRRGGEVINLAGLELPTAAGTIAGARVTADVIPFPTPTRYGHPPSSPGRPLPGALTNFAGTLPGN